MFWDTVTADLQKLKALPRNILRLLATWFVGGVGL